MFRKTLFLFVLVLMVGTNTSYSQDIHFSQYYANPVYLNPAFAGTSVCPRVIMNYRNQWPSVGGTYSSYSVSYDQHVDNLSGGVGLMFVTDNSGEGILNTNMVSGAYSYRLQVNRYFSMKAAFQTSYLQKRLDWDKLTFGDQIDPRYGFINDTRETRPEKSITNNIDFSTGILGYSENVYGGFAVHHLTQPNEGYFVPSKLPMKITVHMGGVLDLKHHRKRRRIEDPTLSPNILYMKQGDFKEMNYGLYFNKYPLVGGAWYRQGFENPDALIILMGLQTSVVKIGYSYDVTVSKLSNASGGAHEISFAMQFGCKPKKKRIRTINCPSF